MKITLFLLLSFVITPRSCKELNKCPRGNDNGRYYGIGCRLKCRCKDQNECDQIPEPSTCSDCSPEFYHPPTCQKENIAYNKPTRFSSIYPGREHYISRAVNGIVRDDDHFISNYWYNNDLWWSVDLGHVTAVTEIHLFTRQGTCYAYGKHYPCADDFKGVEIYVTNRTNGGRDDKDLCHTIQGSLLGYVPYKIDLSPPRYGRYVLILLKGGPYIFIVEFRVFECTDYSYGPNCTGVCNCRDGNEVCNKVDGSCISGCPPGYFSSPQCTAECPEGNYGDDCDFECAKCRNNKPCAKSNGYCEDGCENGFYGLKCNKECKCNVIGSLAQDCSHINGQCSCKTNVTGLKCDRCQPEAYGCGPQECKQANSGAERYSSSVAENPLFLPLIIVSCLLIIFLVMLVILFIYHKRRIGQIPIINDASSTNTSQGPNIPHSDNKDTHYVGLAEMSRTIYEGGNTYEGAEHDYQESNH